MEAIYFWAVKISSIILFGCHNVEIRPDLLATYHSNDDHPDDDNFNYYVKC